MLCIVIENIITDTNVRHPHEDEDLLSEELIPTHEILDQVPR